MPSSFSPCVELGVSQGPAGDELKVVVFVVWQVSSGSMKAVGTLCRGRRTAECWTPPSSLKSPR